MEDMFEGRPLLSPITACQTVFLVPFRAGPPAMAVCLWRHADVDGSSSGTWGAMLKLRWRVAYGGLEDSLEEEAEGNASPHTETWVSHFNLCPPRLDMNS